MTEATGVLAGERGWERPAALSRRGYMLLCLAVFALATLPLWFAAFPPLHDYPFHLARMAVLDDLLNGGPRAAFYDWNTLLLPNLAMDAVVLALAQVMPVQVAGRVFVWLTLGGMFAGTIALHRVLHGRRSLVPLAAALLLFNWIFLMGFLNYLFGVALLLWGLVLHLRLRERAAWLRLAVGTLTGLALFFAHFVALMLYAIVVGGLELRAAWPLWRAARRIAWRDLVLGGLPFLAPAALFLLGSPTAQEAGKRISYHEGQVFIPARAVLHKVEHLLKAPLSGDLMVDGIGAVIVAFGITVMLRLARVTLAPALRWGLAAIAALYFVAPWGLFGGWFLDARMPIVAGLLLIAMLRVEFRSAAWRQIALAGLVALLAGRAVGLSLTWAEADRTIQRVAAAQALVPDGSVLFAAIGGEFKERSYAENWQPPLRHIATLAMANAPVFVPATFALASQHSMVVNARYAPLQELQTADPWEMQTREDLISAVRVLRRYGREGRLPPVPPGTPIAYLFLLHPKGVGLDVAGVRVLAREPRFVLLAIEPE